jgi:K+-sensing histidine kinase KdpD
MGMELAMNNIVQQPSDKQLPRPELTRRAVLALRWLALVVVFDLSFFDLSTEGVMVPPLHIVLIVGAVNLLVVLLQDHLRSRRSILNLLAADLVITTLAVYLTGGVHSSFFVLYGYVILSASLYLNIVPSILVTLVVAVLYVLTCSANPAGILTPVNLNILSTKLTLLVVIGFVSAVLLEGIRREHLETEREAVLASRLATLNDLFQELTVSLDLDHVLQTVVHASRRLLGADIAAISLLDENHREAYFAAAEGMVTSDPAESRWPVDEEPFRKIIAGGMPSSFGEAGELPQRVRRIVEREGIRAGIDVPLVLDQTPIGLLSVGQRTPRTYTDEERALLKPLAQEAALAIRNAHLYELEKREVEQLQTLERLQDNFVSYVSHELRTPLTSIKTSVALLQDTQNRVTPPVQKELIETISHNTGRLEGMVSDLLQMTQLEAGRLSLTLQPTDLRAIVERAVRSVHPLFDAKGQIIELRMPEQMDRVITDRRRLEQVLVNLLSNAHKYTPRGAVVSVEMVDKSSEVEFSVSDDGPGIVLAEQEHIFDKFYVGAEAKNRAGVGLGLYITRQLVELFGGHIWVESEPGRGSTFMFTLPKKESNDENTDCR